MLYVESAVSGCLPTAEFPISDMPHPPAFEIACVYAGLDEPDRSFEWLEKAYGWRSIPLLWLNVDQRLDVLRRDPRFAVLLTNLRLQT